MDSVALRGIRGELVSAWFAAQLEASRFASQMGSETRTSGRRAFAGWWRQHGVALGPSSGLSDLVDRGARPLLRALGHQLPATTPVSGGTAALGVTTAPGALPVVVGLWGADLDAWYARAAARGRGRRHRAGADRAGASWMLGFDGRVLRLWDGRRGWARACLDFDLEVAARDDRLFAVLWGLLRPEALAATTADVAAESARHGVQVRSALRDGVREALELLVAALAAGSRGGISHRTHAHLEAAFDESLTIVYRLLFLLFAESRGLLPTWHPTYRRSYSIESIRTRAERPGPHTGLWATIQALSRLAHAGCTAGELTVTAFNGRLFAPSRTPLAESAHVDDEVAARVVLALTTVRGRHGHDRIAFHDLGIEQLGAVYESVLDYEPALAPRRSTAAPLPRHSGVLLLSTGTRRKASGTFYTPRSITDHLVRRALDPVVDGRSAADILALRVLDPAMGSAAFLVAACRHLARAYEHALVRERGMLPGDVTDDDRADYRRLVAQRCLYGVDINPTAVQVARLSLWLVSLAAARPLTFLDHHLSVGNSLVGAGLDELAARPPGAPGRRTREPLPLFDDADASAAVAGSLPLRHELALVPDDDAATVRGKDSLLARLRDEPGLLGRWRHLAHLWCAPWFWDADGVRRPSPAVFTDLARAAMGDRGALPAATAVALQREVGRIAARERFFHWTLEFPEVFFDELGRQRADGGFDVVLTNPPWEMVRGDLGDQGRRTSDRAHAKHLLGFARRAGVYEWCADGHANLYQLFAERCLQLLRPGGRLGLIAPWGLMADQGSAALRAAVFDRCRVDDLVAFDNTDAVFPIHRGVRFLLLSATVGSGPTERVPCRFGLRDPVALESDDACAGEASVESGHQAAHESAEGPAHEPVTLTVADLRRWSGASRAVPCITRHRDRDLLDRLWHTGPPLGADTGWGFRFGRELNATDDRRLFEPEGAITIVEGKHLSPFRIDVARDVTRQAHYLRDWSVLTSPQVRDACRRWRLAYRDVTSVSNRLTLIAALVPPRHVTVHTAQVLKSPAPLGLQAYLCAVLNSIVANFMARLWVTTHIGTTLMERLPVPKPQPDDPAFVALANLALILRTPGADWIRHYAAVQTRVAHLYGLRREEFVDVLTGFPLLEPEVRHACLEAWETPTP